MTERDDLLIALVGQSHGEDGRALRQDGGVPSSPGLWVIYHPDSSRYLRPSLAIRDSTMARRSQSRARGSAGHVTVRFLARDEEFPV